MGEGEVSLGRWRVVVAHVRGGDEDGLLLLAWQEDADTENQQ